MGDTLSENETVVARWANGLAAGVAGLDRLLSPTARIWHITDGEGLSKECRAAPYGGQYVCRDRPTFRDVRSLPTTNGGVVQGTIEPTPGVTVHVVQVLTVETGQIVASGSTSRPNRRPQNHCPRWRCCSKWSRRGTPNSIVLFAPPARISYSH